MLKINLEEFEEKHGELINSKEIVLAKHESEEPLVCYYDGCDFNDYAKYRKINTHHNGGCFVSFKGDFVIAYFSETEEEINDFIENILKAFVKKLQKALPKENIEFVGNDILINDRKISGASSSDYVGFFVGYKPDIDIIREVCNKEMEKIPGSLKEYLSEEELERLLVETIEEFNR